MGESNKLLVAMSSLVSVQISILTPNYLSPASRCCSRAPEKSEACLQTAGTTWSQSQTQLSPCDIWLWPLDVTGDLPGQP